MQHSRQTAHARFRALVLGLGLLLAAGPASALLIGDVVTGDLRFGDGSAGNFLDPALHPGHQQSATGPLPMATVQDPDGGVIPEFFYTDGNCGLCRTEIYMDVDDDTIHISQQLIDSNNPASNLGSWSFTLSEIDANIASVQVSSASFSGITASVVGGDVVISYAGGQDLDASTPQLSVVVTLFPAPEPTTALLLGLGVCALGFGRRRARRS